MSKKWLILIIGAAILMRLAAGFILGDVIIELPGIFDQVSYHQLAIRVLNGYGFTFGTFWWPYTQAGQPTAHWSYLYTLLLAGLYKVVGVHPLVMRLIQAVLSGIFCPVFAYRLGRTVFGEKTGLVAAAWVAFYGYFIYYSEAILTECFYIICVLWVLDCALRIYGRLASPSNNAPILWLWLELGLAFGLAGVFRQVFLLFAPFVFIWLAGLAVFRRLSIGPSLRDQLQSVVKGAIVVGIVLTILIAPITFYNYQRFGRLVLLNTNAGFAFFWANLPVYGDQFVPILDPDDGTPSYQDQIPVELRQLNEAALDNALMQRGFEYVLSNPVRYIRLSLSRIPVYFMFWPSEKSGFISNVVRVASFGLALPFILLGIGSWSRQRLKGADVAPGLLLLLFAVIYSVIHLLSWSLIRYRLPVDAVLLVFASAALVSGLEWCLTRMRFTRRNTPLSTLNPPKNSY
jgi:4-amino-4-deoxy-L-arabinose transferase-like glycosyltransferase